MNKIDVIHQIVRDLEAISSNDYGMKFRVVFQSEEVWIERELFLYDNSNNVHSPDVYESRDFGVILSCQPDEAHAVIAGMRIMLELIEESKKLTLKHEQLKQNKIKIVDTKSD